MIESEMKYEYQSERKEYDFESGLDEVMRRLEKLLETQKNVVVAVTGSSNNVGKSFLSTSIQKRLREEDIPTAWISDISSPFLEYSLFSGGEEKEKYKDCKVLLLHAEYPPNCYTKRGPITEDGSKNDQDEALRKRAEEFGLPFSKVDLRVFVYRPDKPFYEEDEVFADILICNEQAIDDPHKMR